MLIEGCWCRCYVTCISTPCYHGAIDCEGGGNITRWFPFILDWVSWLEGSLFWDKFYVHCEAIKYIYFCFHQAIMERLSMSHPRNHVVITGGTRLTSLTAEIEAGEVAIVKYLASCYRRAFDECTKWKVWSLLSLSKFPL